MSLPKLESAARKALSHPDLKPILALIPASERDSPQALRSWLALAGEVAPHLADTIEAAHGAVVQVEAARGLRDRVGAIYHSAALRAEVTAAGLDFERLADNPEEAYALLVSRGAGGRLSAEFGEALAVLGEVRQFASESGAALPEPVARPIPTSEAGQAAEYQELIGKSSTGKLTGAEGARLQALAEAKVAHQDRQEAAGEAASTQKPAPDEYRTLIAKSVSSTLSEADGARLSHLAGQRAIDAGLATAEDIEAEQQEDTE